MMNILQWIRRKPVTNCIAWFVILATLSCSVESWSRLITANRIGDEIEARFGVAAHIHMLRQENELRMIQVQLVGKPREDPAIVEEAIRDLIESEFPGAQRIEVHIPSEQSRWPSLMQKHRPAP
jgi:hypothetical protein